MGDSHTFRVDINKLECI